MGRIRWRRQGDGDAAPDGRIATAPADGARAIAEAEALLRAGRAHEAIATLTGANRARRDARLEERLVRLRHEAFAGPAGAPGEDRWPPDAPDLFPGATGLPELPYSELSGDALRAGVLRHGALIVRGLLREDRVDALVDDIDRAFAACDAYAAGAPVEETTPWYVPFDAGGDLIARVRKWVRGGGGVLTAESPRSAFDILDAFDEIGLGEILTDYLGERPALSARKWTLRKVPVDTSTNWHQDGAFLGPDLRSINVWLALSRCGDDAPGLDVVPRRIDEILPTGTDGAIFDTSVGPAVVERAARDAPVVRPLFEAGDALLFDDLFLHRTAVGAGMARERYAIESWFFAPSHYPADQIPVTF